MWARDNIRRVLAVAGLLAVVVLSIGASLFLGGESDAGAIYASAADAEKAGVTAETSTPMMMNTSKKEDEQDNYLYGVVMTDKKKVVKSGSVVAYGSKDMKKPIAISRIEEGRYRFDNLPLGGVQLCVTSETDLTAIMSGRKLRQSFKRTTPLINAQENEEDDGTPLPLPNFHTTSSKKSERLEIARRKKMEKAESEAIDHFYGKPTSTRKLSTQIIAGENNYKIVLNLTPESKSKK